jgi:drug/metabolite transporter (DMT)-like permease
MAETPRDLTLKVMMVEIEQYSVGKESLGGQLELGGIKAFQAGAIAMVLASSFLVAVVPNFSKLAYQSGASVPLVIIGRFVVTVLLLGAMLIVQRRSLFTSMRVLGLCLIGGIATAFMSFGVLSAITRIDLSLVILIFYLHPIFIAWFGHVRGTYALSRFRVFCCVLILVGLALALSVSLARLDALGVALALVGACGAAGLLVANGEAVREAGTVIVNFYTAIVALVPACAIGIVIGPLDFPGTNVGWFGLFGTGAAMCLGLALFFAAIPPIGLVRATMITVVEPVFAILLAMVLFGERLSAVQWFGVAGVVAGLLLLETPIDVANRLLGAFRSDRPA